MAKKNNGNLKVALDIGTTKVVAIVADVVGDNIDILGVGENPSYGMKRGVIVNIDATVESIRTALNEAESQAGCQIHSVYTGIAGGHIKSFNSQGVVAIKSKEVDSSDVDRVIEAGKAIILPAEQKILHVLPQEFIVDNQANIHDPVGMYGVRLEARLHIITASISAAQNVVNCIRRCGLNVDDIILEQLASSAAILTDDEKELGVAIVDIGGGTTDIAVFVDGALQMTSVISIAGDQVTNDLAIALRSSTKNAELIKLNSGCASMEYVNPDLWIDVVGVSEDGLRKVQQSDLVRVIEPRYEELFSIIYRELEQNGVLNKLAAGIVFTGGSAQIPGLLPLAQSCLKKPVRIGAPKVGNVDLNKPIYSTSVGLLNYVSQTQTKEFNKTTFPMQNMLLKFKRWFKGNF